MPGASVPSNCTAPGVPGRKRVGEVGQGWARLDKGAQDDEAACADSRISDASAWKTVASEAVELHQNLMGDGFQCMEP
jgi:hypothetical protein